MIHYIQGHLHKTISGISTETLHARRKLDDIFKVFKEKMSIRNTIFGQISFQNGGKINTFLDKQK